MPATSQSENPTPHLNPIQRFFAWLAATPIGTWLIREVATRIDPTLIYATHGKVNVGKLVGIRELLLTTTGAKTGLPRTVPLLYFEDSGRYVVIGSNVGMKFDAGWVVNLRKNPEAIISIDGQEHPCIAAEVPSPERERLYATAETIYAGFRQYQQRAAPRHIPVFTLTLHD
jgi:deazaflavin-dependent oxidoreductase (nitroreductase family)